MAAVALRDFRAGGEEGNSVSDEIPFLFVFNSKGEKSRSTCPSDTDRGIWWQQQKAKMENE